MICSRNATPGRRFVVAACTMFVAAACGGTVPQQGDSAAATVPAAETTGTGQHAGWETLFDGSTLGGWRGYRRDDTPAAWQVEDGALAFVPGSGDGGDIITRDQYADFELEIEWRVAPAANSGIFYRATEETGRIYENATEMQVLDNAGHADGRSPLTSAGSNFGLYAVEQDVTRPVGEWNSARIVARGAHIEHWLNGHRVVVFEQGGDDWKARVAASKFAAWPAYGQSFTGHIGLQDHGDRVWFRNIRIRRLDP
ncbi:DUF1080 domain-containing protein [soil metagenome]